MTQYSIKLICIFLLKFKQEFNMIFMKKKKKKGFKFKGRFYLQNSAVIRECFMG